MAEEAKDPNAARAENPIAAEDAPANSGAETTSVPDSDAPKASEAAKQPELANPAAGTAHTPSIAEETAPSDEEAAASPLPSANKPDMEPTGPDAAPTPKAKATEGAPEATPTAAAAAGKAEAKPAKAKPAADGDAKPAKAKKEKAPALEDKPFAEFINQDFLPSLTKSLTGQGVSDLELAFEKRSLPIKGVDNSDLWQVIGHMSGGKRQFIIGFTKEDINSAKVFCCADNGATPSLLESFMIDERRVNLDLLLLYTVQRLNGQKWLGGN